MICIYCTYIYCIYWHIRLRFYLPPLWNFIILKKIPLFICKSLPHCTQWMKKTSSAKKPLKKHLWCFCCWMKVINEHLHVSVWFSVQRCDVVQTLKDYNVCNSISFRAKTWCQAVNQTVSLNGRSPEKTVKSWTIL